MVKADKIGLVIVLASLAAIAAIAYLVMQYQHEHRLESIRSQGVSLVRAMSGVPFEQLEPGGTHRGLVQVLRHSALQTDLAYLSIIDREGRNVDEIAADGVIVPAPDLPKEPSAWLGETRRDLPQDRGTIVEFHAPLLSSGDLAGFVRLGYRYPTMGLDIGQLRFFAAVALPVFLLVPLFYLLLRREVRPVRIVSHQLGRMMEDEQFQRLEVSATGELGDFMQRFNHFVEHAGHRIEGLEEDQKRLLTSTKLLTYRKNRVETVLETLPEAIVILDESGAITYANQKLAAMFGVPQETILTQPPAQWCDNSDIIQLLANHRTGTKGRAFTDTIRFNIDSVARQSIVTKTYPLFAPKNPASTIGTLIVFRDESQEALARQAREDFVAHLSHELKSPLNVLAMYSETMLTKAGQSEEFRIEAANVISDEVSRLSTLINGLLSMTQIENGSLTPDKKLVKLREVASAAFDEARHSAKDKDLSFVFDAPKEMSPVLVDKDLIRIAITNLLSNAVKYNREGGEVRVTIEETEDALQIRVADTGIGLTEEESAKVFDKFYRSTDDRVQAVGGHGLGLALTKQIVELHHGSLSVDLDRDAGTEFIINLWKETTAVRQVI